MTSRCSSTPTGAPMAPPISPVTTTEAMTIAMVCRGVMPEGLVDAEVVDAFAGLQDDHVEHAQARRR